MRRVPRFQVRSALVPCYRLPSSSRELASLPELFGPGCVVVYTSTDFWIDYLVLLFHETCACRRSLYGSRH